MEVKIFENIINYKLKSITAEELLKYANQFQLKLSKSQAEKIAKYLRGSSLNIFQDAQRAQVIKDIAKIAGPETAIEINKLFITFTR
ncbi:MAG: hypothetical protein K0S25_1315 [Bacillus sp. (in: firmicutes)]|jgi:hypothetical protein|uniref:DUF2624 domain-containing protein n=1 Tax=Bacillus sp. 1NLA3E TaxID=666686 RepID=UPI000327F640|nr:DUF2624 domain-containing protein [Bacillus sp. 1NLA3E]AGK54943.1 hypothetical protein B1NLA3E_15995 [Bacillus sp. 1NLA3E]MDF2903677.1 hypothetical protein [Bacillus sp. (in: firmicutes)]